MVKRGVMMAGEQRANQWRDRTDFTPEDLKIGDRFRDRIDESISVHDKLLLSPSEHSVNSPWVQDQVEAAL
jgi:hypothetical protein